MNADDLMVPTRKNPLLGWLLVYAAGEKYIQLFRYFKSRDVNLSSEMLPGLLVIAATMFVSDISESVSK